MRLLDGVVKLLGPLGHPAGGAPCDCEDPALGIGEAPGCEGMALPDAGHDSDAASRTTARRPARARTAPPEGVEG